MAVRDYKGAAPRTALAGLISSSATSFTVAASGGTGYPTGAGGNFVVAIDMGLASEEKILCAARTGDVFTVATGGRGWDDTTAAAHNNSATVDHVGTATDLREANAHVNATGAAHGTTGVIVGTTDTQTLTNKTLTTPTIGSFTNAQHDHSGAAGGSKLAQANTHQSPDTDSATTSLHHTLGSGANQAAAGNHTHTSGGGALGGQTVVPAESTSSSTFTDLTTAGPAITITVPASGIILLNVGAQMNGGAANMHAEMSAQVGGAAASSDHAVMAYLGASTGDVAFSRTSKISGLTPGASLTLTAKYLVSGTGSVTFSHRTISAIAV